MGRSNNAESLHRHFPFNLVYGKEVVLPTHLAIPSLALVQYIDEAPTSSLQLRQLEILKLQEKRE